MFSKTLKKLRTSRNLLQKDIAVFLGITTSAYGFYEQGKRDPDTDTLKKLADFFGVTTDYLLGRDEPLQKQKSLPPQRERLLQELIDADEETAKELEQYLNYLKLKKEQTATGTIK